MYTQLTLYIRIYVFTYVVWVYGYAYELSAVYLPELQMWQTKYSTAIPH